MAASLVAHGDDGVHAAGFQPARLFHRRGGSDHLRAAGLHARLQFGRRQAEVETHDFRLDLFNQGTGCFVKRRAIDGRHLRVQVDAELRVVRRQMRTPLGLTLRIRLRRRVAEEIQVDRAAYRRTKLLDLLTNLVCTQHRAGD